MDQHLTIMPLEFAPARQVLAREDAGTRQPSVPYRGRPVSSVSIAGRGHRARSA